MGKENFKQKPKFEKTAKLGPIFSAIGFCLIIFTVVFTAIPPVEEFVHDHLTLFAIWLGCNFLISTVGFILSQINTHNETYHDLVRINEQCKKWKDQLK